MLSEVEDWFPIRSLFSQVDKKTSDSKEELKEKILAEIKALEAEQNLSSEQKRHLEALRDLAERLGE